MTARSDSTSFFRGRRPRRGGRPADHGRAGSRGGLEPAAEAIGAPRSRRHGGQSQDRALYACSCGFDFDALVSTSVDCPECGSPQAW